MLSIYLPYPYTHKCGFYNKVLFNYDIVIIIIIYLKQLVNGMNINIFFKL